jgi:hypothetical protein
MFPPEPAGRRATVYAGSTGDATRRDSRSLATTLALHLLHAWIGGSELCDVDLAKVPERQPPAVSNPLQCSVDRSIVGTHREGVTEVTGVLALGGQHLLILKRGLDPIEGYPEQ